MKSYNRKSWTFFPSGKKGMEFWQLVLIIIAALTLLFFIAWYGVLGGNLGSLIDKFGGLV